MSPGEGARVWLIPDGYLATPPGDGKPYQSHEAICILNTGISDAHIRLDLFFEDRDPIREIRLSSRPNEPCMCGWTNRNS